jgi:hypothetical protein
MFVFLFLGQVAVGAVGWVVIAGAYTVPSPDLMSLPEYKYRLQQHHNFPHLQQLNLSM